MLLTKWTHYLEGQYLKLWFGQSECKNSLALARLIRVLLVHFRKFNNFGLGRKCGPGQQRGAKLSGCSPVITPYIFKKPRCMVGLGGNYTAIFWKGRKKCSERRLRVNGKITGFFQVILVNEFENRKHGMGSVADPECSLGGRRYKKQSKHHTVDFSDLQSDVSSEVRKTTQSKIFFLVDRKKKLYEVIKIKITFVEKK